MDLNGQVHAPAISLQGLYFSDFSSHWVGLNEP
jgi:hypothetical protein